MSVVLHVDQVSKSFGTQHVLTSVSFDMGQGQVLGLLGPNGAGKTTLMSLICGLQQADSGIATIWGRPYRDLTPPIRSVGALLEPSWMDARLTCNSLLVIHAMRLGLPQPSFLAHRMLRRVGLRQAAGKRIGTLSLGMRQRLALGVALLGSPQLLIADEPINGLDADGVLWVRRLIAEFAAQGGSVLLSSHLMDEVEHTATHVAILSHGRIMVHDSLEGLRSGERASVFVPQGEPDALIALLRRQGCQVTFDPQTRRYVAKGAEPVQVFRGAAATDTPLTFLSAQHQSLEDIYMSYR